MPGRSPMEKVSRKVVFRALQGLIAGEAVVVGVTAALEFQAAAGGDAAVLFLSGLLVLLAAALAYLVFGIRSRGSGVFYSTLAASLFSALLLLGTQAVPRFVGIAIAIVVIVSLILLRGQFQLRPGEMVKEEKLPADVLAKLSTKVRGVRCRECGDDDVWITSDRLLACKNCGSVQA